EDVGAAGDLIVHDALVHLQLVVVTAQLLQRDDRVVAGAVGVVHRRTVDGLAVLPDRQLVGDRKRLAVADDHAVDGVVGHPGTDPGVDAHASEANLVLRAFLMLIGKSRQLLLMRAPPHLGGGGALLAESLDAPRVDEFADLLRHIGNLGVAFAAMDDLHSDLLRQNVEPAVYDKLRDLLGLPALEFFVGEQTLADVDQTLLGEMRDEAGVGAMFNHGRRALDLPLREQAAQVHLAPVEGLGGWFVVRQALVGIPQLGGRVDVADAAVVAPLENLKRIDVPGEVDNDVARGNVLAQQRTQVLAGDAVLDEIHALRRPLPELLGPVLEIHDRDVLGRHFDVLEDDWERALGHGAIAHEEDIIGEFDHDLGRLLVKVGAEETIGARPAPLAVSSG